MIGEQGGDLSAESASVQKVNSVVSILLFSVRALKKSLPTLGGLTLGLGRILPDGCRGGYQSQFAQLITDAWAAPSRIGTPGPSLNIAPSS